MFIILSATSDGSKEGLNQKQGGSCIRYNMKIQIRVHNKIEYIDKGKYLLCVLMLLK